MRETLTKIVSVMAVLGLTSIGCVGEDPEGGTGDDGKADAWNRANDPRNFGNDFVYNWTQLNTPELASGRSQIVPWPDTYWPMQEDGYNARWREGMSPVERYDQAFNGWTPAENFMSLRRFQAPGQAYDQAYYDGIGPATTWAHTVGGNYSAREINRPDGTLDPSADRDGNGIADSDNNGDGRTDREDNWNGLEGWWGHCHAWAPAAFSAAEPQHSVTVNGVEFAVADIKALIESTYEGGGSVFLGGRCNTREVTRDDHGRITATECRDTNAGAFHVVTLNVIGRLGRSFVIDATYDYQVWNQPVRDYTIRLQEEVTLQQALQLVNRTDVTTYPYNSDARRFVHVQMDFRYIVEGSASTTPYVPQIDSYTRTHRYDYLLELDQTGNIIGGEWIDDNPHPDFIWAPTGNSDVTGSRWGGPVVISRSNVQSLIDQSTSTTPPPPTGDEHNYDAAPNAAIPDNNATGVSSTITVPDSLVISGLRVAVDVAHSWAGDLTVNLVRNGRTVTLVANEGGDRDDLVQTFDVRDFNGDNASGDWTVTVIDNAAQDTGTFRSWRLTVLGN
jgi:hypothetical protein